MNLLVFLLFGLPFAMALTLSWHPTLGRFRTSALNPLLLFAAYIVLVAGDFASMNLTGSGQLANHQLSTTSGVMTFLELKYIAMLIAALSGMTFSLFVRGRIRIRNERPAPGSRANVQAFATVLYLAILGSWLFFLLQYTTNGLSLADAAELRNASSWDSSLFLVTLLLVPSLSYMLPRQSFKVVLPVAAISISLLLYSGSRTRILFVLIPVVFYLVAVRRWRIPRSTFVLGVLILGFLALVALNLRVASSQRQSVTLSELASTSNVFNLNDIAFAETDLALSRLPSRAVEQYLGQSLVGFVLADIPRSTVSTKPFKGSDQFTQAYDVTNWRLYKRGLTIGGINELQYDYPFPLALLLVFSFAALWIWGFASAAASRTIHGFVWSIGFYVMLYAFLKSDLQSAGQILWAFVGYAAVVAAYQRLTGGLIAAPNGARRAVPVMPHP
jgi:hypothetical protein